MRRADEQTFVSEPHRDIQGEGDARAAARIDKNGPGGKRAVIKRLRSQLQVSGAHHPSAAFSSVPLS
jgi:hypothetical protein